MAFPTIPTVAASRVLNTNQADTSGTRTFPSLTGLTKNSGDLLIAICVAYQCPSSGATFSAWGGGFTELSDFGTTGTTMAIGVAYKWSDGTETGTFTVTQAAAVVGHASMFLLSIPGAHPSTPPAAGSFVTGTTSAANPGALNPGAWDVEDTLWVSVVGSGETNVSGSWTGTGTTAPTNYTDRVDTNTTDSSTVGQSEAAVAFRQNAVASEDVGTAGVDLSNARNAACVIAVRPLVWSIAPTGQTVTVTRGTPALALAITPTGATVTVGAGTLTVTQVTPISPTGQTVTATAGTVTVTPGPVAIAPAGKTVAVSAGTPAVALNITPSHATVTVTPGTPAIGLNVSVTGKTVTVTPGTPAVARSFTPSHATVTVTPGTPAIGLNITLGAATVAAAAGTVTVTTGAGGLNITPAPGTVTVTPGTPAIGLRVTLTRQTVTITPGATVVVLTDTFATPTGAHVTVTPGTMILAGPQAFTFPTQQVAITPGGMTVKVGVSPAVAAGIIAWIARLDLAGPERQLDGPVGHALYDAGPFTWGDTGG